MFLRDDVSDSLEMSEFWFSRMREALTADEQFEIMSYWADYVRGGVLKRYYCGGLRVKQRLIYICANLMLRIIGILKTPNVVKV